MAALDFPASPSVNQTYSGPGGVVWVWDGAKWVSGTGTTVYAPVTSPVFLGNPTAPNPPAGDADTSVATTSFVAAAVGTALHDTGRNYIHNPLFNVAQRGAGAFTANNNYTMDRWKQIFSAGTLSTQSVALVDSDRAGIGDETTSAAVQLTFAGGAATTDYMVFQQPIENVRRLSGKTVTASFWAIGGSSFKIGVSVDQNFGTGGSPSAAVSGSGQAVTVTTSWARYSCTLSIPSASGKTLGTNGDSLAMFNLWLSAGSTFNTGSGSTGVQSGLVRFWGVQLEIGSVATPLEKPDPRYDLANAQRFYETGSMFNQVYQAAGQDTVIWTTFTTTKRAIPTVAFSGASYFNGSNVGPNGVSAQSFGFKWTATALGTTWVSVTYTASADL